MADGDPLEFIRTGIRCFDGATGTQLFRYGLKSGACPDAADEEMIRRVHRDYLSSGAQFVTTNTFGASRTKLAKYRMGDAVRELNIRNARLARGLQEEPYFVAGDIGPTGELIEPYGELAYDDFFRIFREQAEALAEGAVDLIIIETMLSAEEVRAAIQAAKLHTALPVIACMTFDQTPHGFVTTMGVQVETAVQVMEEAGADVIGTNCTLDPTQMPALVREFKRYTQKPLLAQPNAGTPRLVNFQTHYEPVENLETHLEELIKAGAQVIGGCCGTDPPYIVRLRKVIDRANERRTAHLQ
jgi:5-methyltetrahydrofolate--homocysteine methyltransferase